MRGHVEAGFSVSGRASQRSRTASGQSCRSLLNSQMQRFSSAVKTCSVGRSSANTRHAATVSSARHFSRLSAFCDWRYSIRVPLLSGAGAPLSLWERLARDSGRSVLGSAPRGSGGVRRGHPDRHALPVGSAPRF